MRRRAGAAAALLAAATLLAGRGRAEAQGAAPAARVWVAGEGVRVRREEIGSALSRGEGNWVWRPGEPVRVAALRGEVAAVQVIVEAGEAPLEGVQVELDPLVLVHEGGAAGAPTPAPMPTLARFVEHYVEVRERTRNARSDETLGWSPGARPPDAEMLGWVPDALIPVDAGDAGGAGQRAPGARPLPYPLAIAPRQNGAVWVDITVPEDAAPGVYTASLRVGSAAHGELSRLPLRLTVADAALPYRPVSFFAFYEPFEMAERLGDATPSGASAAELSVWQLLHQHHVDAIVTLRDPEDVARIRSALDGSLFTAAHGYRGPGAGVPPAVAALGAYGSLGEPGPEALRRVEALVPLLPAAIQDVFLYAIDEQCDSPRGPTWRRLIRGSPVAKRVRVAHTCHRDPNRQDVDLVMMPANTFQTNPARAARAVGTGVWVYNGALPRSGTLMLDAPPTSLLANGWIAASYPVGRWFLWEVGFWHDGNRGGRGPIDPFVVAENFHNADGDSCLGDGLLLYPGTQSGKFAAGSLGIAGVLPSMRLKALRRGIQDAGYFALARAANAAAADGLMARVIPAALDEADPGRPAPWPSDGAAFAAARDALRALIPAGAAMDEGAVHRTLGEAANARSARAAALAADRGRRMRLALAIGTVAVVVVIAVALVLAQRARRAHRRTRDRR